MSRWIVTLGQPDIQLQNTDNWIRLCRSVRDQLHGRGFFPNEGGNEKFTAPARVMGTVYGSQAGADYFGDLEFPLLDACVQQLQDKNITEVTLVLTNQEATFEPDERLLVSCPYWQDTCSLQPLLERYLQEKLPNSTVKVLLVQTPANHGLENWTNTMRLVQSLLSDFNFDSDVYVTHQSGNRAVASALQFTMQNRGIKFLVSNEVTGEAEIVDLHTL